MKIRLRKEGDGRFTLFVSHPGYLRMPPLYENGLSPEEVLETIRGEAAEADRVKEAVREASKPLIGA